MAARDNLAGTQFQQLPMFMTAGEIKDTVRPGDAEGYDSESDMWSAKTDESHVEGSSVDHSAPNRSGALSLADSVAREGVREPVGIFHEDDGPMLGDGHHRVATAYAQGPGRYVPVEHHESMRSGYGVPVFPSGVIVG